jgi:hypothetical protein
MTTDRQRRYTLTRDALILHCPDPLRAPDNPFHPEWLEACRRFFADESLRGACRDRENLTIITYNTREAPCLLEKCFEHLGLSELVVLGSEKEDWCWEYKISLVWEYLQSGSCRTEYVMCLDGDDSLVLADPEVVLNRFIKSDCEMLFTSTAWDWPPSADCWQFEESVSSPADWAHCHLNAGGYLGRRSYVTARLAEIMAAIARQDAWCMTPRGFDDQLAWRQLHRRYYPAIKVDATSDVFIRFDPDR